MSEAAERLVWAVFRGGPLDGLTLHARLDDDGEHVVSPDVQPTARYRISDDHMVTVNWGVLPIADYVGRVNQKADP